MWGVKKPILYVEGKAMTNAVFGFRPESLGMGLGPECATKGMGI